MCMSEKTLTLIQYCMELSQVSEIKQIKSGGINAVATW